jgi:hypothetical protein
MVRLASGRADVEWSEVPVPHDGPTPFAQWLAHIADGTRATENIDLALDLTTLVDAADRSARSGREIAIEPQPTAGRVEE